MSGGVAEINEFILDDDFPVHRLLRQCSQHLRKVLENLMVKLISVG